MRALKPDDCVELVAVHRDGTVERWEDDVATRVWAACDWSWLDESEKPTVTRPLRMVSWTPCGRYFDGDDVSPQGIEDDEGQVEPFRKMVPDECVLRRGIGVGPGRGLPLLHGAEGFYRVVVEFVPKGEKR